MAGRYPVLEKSFVLDAAYERGIALMKTATEGELTIAGAGDDIVGFNTAPTKAAGQSAPVELLGIAEAWAGDTGDFGDALKVGALGKLIPATVASDKVVAVAMEDYASGDLFSVLIIRTFVSAATPTLLIADPGASGAIAVTNSGHVEIVTAGAETRTIAAPSFIGQRLLISFKTKVGNATITVASTVNRTGNNTVALTAAGQAVELVASASGSSFVWNVAFNDSATLSTV